MAIVDGRTLLDNADANTNWNEFGGGATTTETDSIIQGTGSQAITNDSTTSWQGVFWDNGSNIDLSGNHLFFWFNHAAAGLVEEIVFRAADNAGTTNYIQKRIATPFTDRSPRKYTGGWVQIVVSVDDLFEQFDLAQNTAPTAGTARWWGLGGRLVSGVMPKKQDNLFLDASYRLPANTPAIRIEGTNGGAPWTWQDVLDWSLSNNNGLVQEVNGVFMVNGPIQIGDAASTSSTVFSDATGKVIQFTDDWFVEDDFFGITIVGNATGTTDVDFGTVVGTGDDRQGAGGGVIRSSRKAFTIDAETDIADVDTFNMYGVTLQGAGITQFSGSTKTDIIGCSFIDCAEIQPNDAEFLNNTIIAPRGRGLEMLSTHNIKQCNFIAGDKTQTVETFGTATVSSSETPADPYTFSHTVASGSTDVALLVFVGKEDSGNPSDRIWSVTYNGEEMTLLGTAFALGQADPNVTAWILYNPTQGSSQTVSIDLQAGVDTLSAKAINLRGVPPLSKIKTSAAVGDSVSTFNNSIIADTANAYSVDFVCMESSSSGGTGTADGDNTETDDAAIGTEGAYFISEITGGLQGTRQHDWSWSGGADRFAQLIVLFEEQITEHHIHHNNIGDNTVTYEGMRFFGFGAAGAPKWHGENSQSGADITIAAQEGSNPAVGEFENTGSPTAGTIAVTNAVTVRVEGVTEGAAISVIANETVGTQRVGDIIMEKLADSTGVAQITDFNYEGAFDPSGLDVVVKARQAGLPNGAKVSDNGTFTDFTPEVNSSALGFGAGFGGTSEYLSRGGDLTGIADSGVGTLSFWFKRGATGAQQVIMQDDNVTSRFLLEFTVGNDIRLVGRNTAGTIVLDIETTTAITDTNNWHHCLIAWNLAVANESFIYIDNTEDTTRTTHTTSGVIDLTTNVTDWGIGDRPDGSGNNFNGSLAEFWFTTTYLDPTVTKNRREFYTVNGIPAYLGAKGGQPTGTNAIVYLGGSSRFSNWQTNRGTGGGFTENGTLTDAGNVTDVNMYPATPVIDQDSFYIGHATTFAGIKLDLVIAAGGSPTITPQYWNGSIWTSLTGVVDNTSNLTTTGENKITWTVPGNWAKSTEDGLNLFWMRLLFDAGTMTTNPEVRKINVDVNRYIPFTQNRAITSSGLTVVATWVRDRVGTF